MTRFQVDGPCRIERLPLTVPAETRQRASDAIPRLVLTACRGSALPAEVHDPRLEEAGSGLWRLACREGRFEFHAAGVELLEPRPDLFQALLAGHALRPRDRLVVRSLLGLLRLPGGARLLRAWHARRG